MVPITTSGELMTVVRCTVWSGKPWIDEISAKEIWMFPDISNIRMTIMNQEYSRDFEGWMCTTQGYWWWNTHANRCCTPFKSTQTSWYLVGWPQWQSRQTFVSTPFDILMKGTMLKHFNPTSDWPILSQVSICHSCDVGLDIWMHCGELDANIEW